MAATETAPFPSDDGITRGGRTRAGSFTDDYKGKKKNGYVQVSQLI